MQFPFFVSLFEAILCQQSVSAKRICNLIELTSELFINRLLIFRAILDMIWLRNTPRNQHLK